MNSQEQNLRYEYADLQKQLADPSIYSSKEYPSLAKRQSELDNLLKLYDDLSTIKEQQAQSQTLVDAGGELSELAAEELEDLKAKRSVAE